MVLYRTVWELRGEPCDQCGRVSSRRLAGIAVNQNEIEQIVKGLAAGTRYEIKVIEQWWKGEPWDSKS
jgi:hypothetical protein